MKVVVVVVVAIGVEDIYTQDEGVQVSYTDLPGSILVYCCRKCSQLGFTRRDPTPKPIGFPASFEWT